MLRPLQSKDYNTRIPAIWKAKAGRNHFKLLCNGVLLEDLAPGETNGYFQAIRKKYVVRNDTDHLSLSFQSVSGKCFLNAIKLRRIQ